MRRTLTGWPYHPRCERIAGIAPTNFAELEARVRGLESRVQRTEEDAAAIITTVSETREDVRWLKRAVQVLLEDRGRAVPPEDDE
ncbi:hypothetical protein [Actinopolymorpha pittospori]|uniref:Coiled-coil protein SlyX n=1 Tax=Actinopolymorpha pittospori TaxID=648752 RepID=A0A927N1I8_9ACTN|nr:hypothetical protein [Actinopolymorpha pittospori]MBE1610057.1 putative coiled-coil protein SlyX [Actinopolymorpha pittospori]